MKAADSNHRSVDGDSQENPPQPPEGLVPFLRTAESTFAEGVQWLSSYREVVRKTGHLAALEGRLAARGAVQLLLVAIFAALTLFSTWLALLALVAVQLHAAGVSPTAVALMMILLHLVLLAMLAWLALRTAADLRFQRTRESMAQFGERDEAER